jgi:hypothetical protein
VIPGQLAGIHDTISDDGRGLRKQDTWSTPDNGSRSSPDHDEGFSAYSGNRGRLEGCIACAVKGARENGEPVMLIAQAYDRSPQAPRTRQGHLALIERWHERRRPYVWLRSSAWSHTGSGGRPRTLDPGHTQRQGSDTAKGRLVDPLPQEENFSAFGREPA